MQHFAKIDLTSAGDNVIVSGSTYPNRRIAILNYTILSDSDVTVQWKSGASDLSGPMTIAAKGGLAPTNSMIFSVGGGPLALFQTLNGGDDLILDLSGNAVVGGHLTYFVLNG